MFQLFKKVFIIIIIVNLFLFTYIEFFPLFYNTKNSIRWLFIKAKSKNTIFKNKKNIILLGDSRLNTDVDVRKIPNSYSFATGGATAIAMYYSFKNYLKNNPSPDTLILSLSPRSLTTICSFWEYGVKNNFFSYHEISEIFYNIERLNDDKVLETNFPKLKYIAYKLNYIGFYQMDIKRNRIFMAYNKNNKMIAKMEQLNGKRIYPNLKKSCSDLNYETGMKIFKESPLLNYYLIQIFELCKKNNIHLIFEAMPMNKSSHKVLSNKMLQEYKIYIKHFAEKYPNFDINDSLYFYSDKYFGDASHLNTKGEKIFTDYFLNRFFKKRQ